jgi:6-phosphogluconolactonase (cycloisomerase 2 family)
MSLSRTNSLNVSARLKRDGASYVTTARAGRTVYVFVAGFEDDDVSVFSVAADGALTKVSAGRLSPDRAASTAH